MRAVRIIVVLLVIVGVAFGLYYLDQRGTFRMTHNGEEAEIIQPPAGSGPNQGSGQSADNANGVPAATNPEHEAAMQAPMASQNGPSGAADASATSPSSTTMGRAPGTNMMNTGQMSSSQSSSQMSSSPAQVMTIRGMQYSCTVIGPAPRVQRAPRSEVAQTYTTTRVRHYRRREPMRMQSEYAPMPYASFHPVCSNWQKGPDGFHQVTLPSGMLINIGLDHQLVAGVDMPGETFGGYLIGPITYCGMVVIPAGARVQAVVTQSRTRGLFSEADSVLAMQLTAIDANGWRFPVMGTGMSRIMPDDGSLEVVAYKDPNDGAFKQVQRRGRNVVLPEQSVVSFWLQAPSAVYF